MPHCYRKEPKLTYKESFLIILHINCYLAPGPGSYRLPSEFGYYEDKRIHRRWNIY